MVSNLLSFFSFYYNDLWCYQADMNQKKQKLENKKKGKKNKTTQQIQES